jgi:hypothetical protein
MIQILYKAYICCSHYYTLDQVQNYINSIPKDEGLKKYLNPIPERITDSSLIYGYVSSYYIENLEDILIDSHDKNV